MRKHIPFIVFFFLLLITGTIVYSDYGVSWDEAECRIDNGILNTNFIKTNDENPVLESISKYHGAAFEMFLVTVERIGGYKSSHEIFLMRHLVTFYLFALSVFFFYLLCLRTFRSGWYAFAGCLILVLSPRIFADSFYNTKDLPFLSFIIINFYLIVQFLNNKSIRNAIVCAIVTGVMIDIRIMGLILPVFTGLYLLLDFLKFKQQRKQIVKASIIFGVVLTGTIILFWPVMWLGPLHHFMLAWQEMSMYPWEGTVLYNGLLYKAGDLPLHYLPVWILITTPPLYTTLFVLGFAVLLKKLFTKSALIIPESFSLLLFIFPLASVLFLGSVVYDGWRHLFFIYPAIVLIAVCGLRAIIELINERFRKYFISLVAAYFASIVITMAELHPFENVYFNSLISTQDINGKYEIDYWGLSYKQGFEYILNNDTSDDIIVCLGEPQPGIDNMLFLPLNSRRRITITDLPELSDYYLTCHRYDRKLTGNGKVHQIGRNGMIIHSIYDLRYGKLSLTAANQVADYSNNYETVPEQFQPQSVVLDTISKGDNHVEEVKSSTEYAGNFNIHPPESITINSPGKKYMIATVKFYSFEPFRARIVLQVDSSKTYHWINTIFNNSFTNQWNTYKYICEIPDIVSTSDILKVHIQNHEKGEFLLDDFSIQFFVVDTALVNSVRKTQPL